MIGGDGINDESNKTAPAPIIIFFEWYAISKTEVAIGEGIIIEKQTLSALATITAISVAIITPTSALAKDMKYNQAIYEENRNG